MKIHLARFKQCRCISPLTSIDVPNANRVVCGAREEVGRLPVDVEAPDGAAVRVGVSLEGGAESAQALPVDGVP